jgi:tRNA threonylcarbamoyladenosine biosynthesis protein TsaB
MILAIDSSTRYGGVALADAQRVVVSRSWYSSVNHTVELMPAVAQTLQSWGLTPIQLEGIAVALGPGGFSALRVGLSVAKGVAMTWKRPIVGIGTLELEAFPYLESGLPVCALLDAGRGEVASAQFGPDGRRMRDDLIVTPEALLDSISRGEASLGPTLFCGEGVTSWVQLIQEWLGPKALVLAHPTPATRLWSLVELARRRLAAGETSDLATLQPYYLRMPSIGSPKRRDRIPQQS